MQFARHSLSIGVACRAGCAAVVLILLASGWFSRPAIAADPLRKTIDAELKAAWDREKITPAPKCDDATFLRRIYLDLTGLIPTHDEAKAFLDNADADKRTKLIERLLADPRYAVHQADVWDSVLFGRNPPGEHSNKREGFVNWLRESFAANKPYDELVRAMLLAEGNTAEQGAPHFLLQYSNQPEDAAMAVTQAFLGVQLQCARCHDHPYESWKQVDFYGVAAFFARLKAVKAGKAGQLDKVYVAEMNTGDVKFTGPAKDAQPGKSGVAVKPKFLAGADLDEPDLSKDFKDEKRPAEGKAPEPPKFSRKEKLAAWVTATDNPYFARAAVNRVWAQYLGRGIVHPVDNLSKANPPSHPALLDTLAQQFVENKFDLKWLTREIVSSEAYQLAAAGDVAAAKALAEPVAHEKKALAEPVAHEKATNGAAAMPQWFERARVRPLSAEELLESWRLATGYDATPVGAAKKKEGRFYGVTWDYVRRYFGESVTGVGDFQGGLQEHLYLNNGELGQLIASGKGGLLDAIADAGPPVEERVERLFLSLLSRRPTDAEKSKFAEYLGTKEDRNEDRNQRAKDAIWVLMTCAEFRFNH